MRLRALSASMVVLAMAAPRAARAQDEARQACVAASTEGQSLRDEGKLVAARDRFAACAKDECSAVVRRHCAEWLAAVEERLPTLIVQTKTSYGDVLTDARVTIDGRAVTVGAATPLDPGEHALHAERGEWAPVDAHVLVSEGERGRVVDVRFPIDRPALAPIVSHTPESQHLLPLSTSLFLVTGVAGLAAFSYLGIDTEHQVSALRSTCAPRCTTDEVDAAKREALVADVCLGVGLAALAAAAYTWLTRASGPEAPKAAVDVAPTRGGAVGHVGLRF